jgi:cupin 2 domain-containing protein
MASKPPDVTPAGIADGTDPGRQAPVPLDSSADVAANLATGNVLLNLPPAGSAAEEFVTLGQSAGAKVARIVSHGHASPEGKYYDQADEEFVYVVSGRAGLEFEGQEDVTEMNPGDWIVIPAHRRHRVAWTASDAATVWLVVHY